VKSVVVCCSLTHYFGALWNGGQEHCVKQKDVMSVVVCCSMTLFFWRTLEWGAGAVCYAKGCEECGDVLQQDSIVLAHFDMGGRSSVLHKTM